MIYLKCELCETMVRFDCDEEDLPPVECIGIPKEDPLDARSHGMMVLA